jgi:hypothetical protein
MKLAPLTMQRRLIVPAAMLTGLCLIGAMSLWLPAGSRAAMILLDHAATPDPAYPFTFPFTIQNLLHLLLAAGIGELAVRWRVTVRLQRQIASSPLPESWDVVLQPRDLIPIRRDIISRFPPGEWFPGLIDLCILRFQASHSVEQTVSVLNSALELAAHRLDLHYSPVRYLGWAIPTFGFVGTVVGISLALGRIEPTAVEQPLGEIARALGTSFYTTLVALTESALLVWLHHRVQQQEEFAVNAAGEYVLHNLVNRLYVGGKE